MKTITRRKGSAVVACLSVAGCLPGISGTQSDSQRHMLELLMPSRIEIVEPFTSVKSFDADAAPDGIELLIQAVNALDNPGLMITGTIRVELNEFVPASGNERGKPLERWDIDLSTVKQQKAFWNQLTQMYQFRLGVDPERVAKAERYILSVTYSSPLGGHLTDECVLSARSAGPVPAGLRPRNP